MHTYSEYVVIWLIQSMKYLIESRCNNLSEKKLMEALDLSGFLSQIFTYTFDFEIAQHCSLAISFDLLFKV